MKTGHGMWHPECLSDHRLQRKIWTWAGPELGSEQGSVMIVLKALYGLKTSGGAFRALLAEILLGLHYVPLEADPDIWLQPAVKLCGFEYY